MLKVRANRLFQLTQPLRHAFHAACSEFNPLPQPHPKMGRITMKLTRRVQSHSLLCLLVRSHRSLKRLLRTARIDQALHCVHSFAHSRAHGKQIFVHELYASISYHFSPMCIPIKTSFCDIPMESVSESSSSTRLSLAAFFFLLVESSSSRG